mmetsp:Transcript_23944/g.39928  ORF Transcript_23944/g.39928 Transcript_23944/m.39928 type:complete len:497 (-) Transcript_23944:173-1663(-)
MSSTHFSAQEASIEPAIGSSIPIQNEDQSVRVSVQPPHICRASNSNNNTSNSTSSSNAGGSTIEGEAESVLNISAHKYGNYHKYYSFHPSSARSRFFQGRGIFINLWRAQGEPDVFSILDIGCNEGDLSYDLLGQVKQELPTTVTCILLGIDLDSSLIALANSKYCSHAGIRSNTIATGMNGGTSDASSSSSGSCSHIRAATSIGSSKGDRNIEFHTLNIMDAIASETFFVEYWNRHRDETKSASTQYNNSSSKFGFNLVCLFSITMWIHLNHHDEGLLAFLAQSMALLQPRGSLVVEPQPWKCYRNADKRCRRMGLQRPLHFGDLRIRGNIEEEIVSLIMRHQTIDGSMQMHQMIRSSNNKSNIESECQSNETNQAQVYGMQSYWNLGQEGWGRTIYVFHRSSKDIPYTVVLPVAIPSSTAATGTAGNTSCTQASDGTATTSTSTAHVVDTDARDWVDKTAISQGGQCQDEDTASASAATTSSNQTTMVHKRQKI